jgi:hypothetical protein
VLLNALIYLLGAVKPTTLHIIALTTQEDEDEKLIRANNKEN